MPDRKVALVIGNADYTVASKLRAPKEDAGAMAGVLKHLGFEVWPVFDGDFIRLRDQIDNFLDRLRDDTIALLYFSGHGAQKLDRSNYLLAVDANIARTEDLDRFGFRVDDLLEDMRQRARVSLMFLDACRDDPFADATRGLVTKGVIAKRSGFAPVPVPEDRKGQALIAHAGEEGRTINDAAQGLSPFTAELVVHLARDLEIHDVLREVREAVQSKTGTQTPWTNDALTDEVYLRRNPAAVKRGNEVSVGGADVRQPDDLPEPVASGGGTGGPVPPWTPVYAPPVAANVSMKPVRRFWIQIAAGLSVAVMAAGLTLKPSLLCGMPGLESELAVCQPDFTTATGLATLIPQLDAPEASQRSAALARLVGAFEPGSPVAALDQRLLVQAILAYAHPDRVLSLGSDGQTNLIFVLSEIPKEAWDRPGWSGVRAAAQAAHARLGNSFREGGWSFSTTRPAYYEEFGRRIGIQPAPTDEMTGAGLARLIPDLSSPDPNVSGMAKKTLLGTYQTDVLPLAEKAVLTKAVLDELVEVVKRDRQMSSVVSLLELLAAVPQQDWQEPSWNTVRAQAVSAYYLIYDTARLNPTDYLPTGVRTLLDTLVSNLQIVSPERPVADMNVRVFFAGYEREEELKPILARVKSAGDWRFDGEPNRTEAAIGLSEVRYRGEGTEALAMLLAKQLGDATGRFVSIALSTDVPRLTLDVYISEF